MKDEVYKMKFKKPLDVIAGYLLFFSAILIFTFSAFKSWRMSFTIDESASYLFYAHDTYRHIITYTRLEANNHVLNSVLMKFFSSRLPLSEITLRLPNVLSHALFLFATWLLIKDFKNAWFRLSLYLFINLNPYLLDFFSLARGYALSWALMTLSLYFLKQFIESPQRKFILIACCFSSAALSMMASFPILDFYLALLGLYIIYDFILKRDALSDPVMNRLRSFRFIFILIISAVAFTYVLYISFRLKESNLLYFGGDHSFWKDTVNSLIVSWLYGMPYSRIGISFLQCLVVLISSAGILTIFAAIFSSKHKSSPKPFLYILVSILFLVVICTMMLHYILGTKFLIQRAAGFVLVLFLLTSVYLIDFYIPEKFRLYVALLIGGISIFHFTKSFNTFYVYEWKPDCDTKKMMKDLGAIHKSNADSLILFHAYKKNAAACLFYQELYKYNWMLPVDYSDLLTHAEDYYYLQDDSLNLLKGYKYKVIGHYPEVHESLVQNLQKLKNICYSKAVLNLSDSVAHNKALQKSFPFVTRNNVRGIQISNGAFSPYISLEGSIFQKRSGIYVLASTKVFFPGIRNGVLVVAIYDKNGKILRWGSFDFGNYYLQDSGWMDIPFKLKVDKNYSDADSVRVFIWNTGKDQFLAAEIKAVITEF